MCGQAGVYSTQFSTPEFLAFERLLFINSWRGTDSTGVVRVDKQFKTNSRKSLLSSPEFLAASVSDIVKKDFGPNKESPIALLGHCRAATKGAVTLKNAHPFSFKNVVGMHNGTIHKQFKNRKDFETDSEAFYALLNDMPLVEALDEIQDYDTAYAFQFIDRRDNSLNFIRNSQRPLHFTYAFNETTLLWSSTQEMLQLIIEVNKLNNSGWKGSSTDKIFTLNPNDLLKIPLGKAAREASITHVDVTPHRSYYSGQSYSSGMYGLYSDWDGQESTQNPGYVWRKKADGHYQLVNATTNVPKAEENARRLLPGPSKTEYQNYGEKFSEADLKQLAWLKKAKTPVKEPSGGAKVSLPLPLGNISQKSSAIQKLFDEGVQGFGNLKCARVDVPAGKDAPWEDQMVFLGHNGDLYRDSEFRMRAKNGCCVCGSSFDLSSPEGVLEMSKVHWWTRENFACDWCYKHSEGDWVRRTIEDDWE